jgi:hypothetical protein
MPRSPGLTLEIDDLDGLDDDSSDEEPVASSAEDGSDSSDEDGDSSDDEERKFSDDDEDSDEDTEKEFDYTCDRCEPPAAGSPRPIVGVRYSDGDEDLCADCYAKLARKEQRRYEALRDDAGGSESDDGGSESDGGESDAPPRLSPESSPVSRQLLADDEHDEDEDEDLAELDDLGSIRRGTTPAVGSVRKAKRSPSSPVADRNARSPSPSPSAGGDSSSEQASSDSEASEDSEAEESEGSDEDAQDARSSARSSGGNKLKLARARTLIQSGWLKRPLKDVLDDAMGSSDVDELRDALLAYVRAPEEAKVDGTPAHTPCARGSTRGFVAPVHCLCVAWR